MKTTKNLEKLSAINFYTMPLQPSLPDTIPFIPKPYTIIPPIPKMPVEPLKLPQHEPNPKEPIPRIPIGDFPIPKDRTIYCNTSAENFYTTVRRLRKC